MAENDDFCLAQPTTKVFGNFDAIFGDPIERDLRRLCSITPKSMSGAPLIPLHDRERFFPSLVFLACRPLRFARPTVNDQQHWICAIFALDANPLINPTN